MLKSKIENLSYNAATMEFEALVAVEKGANWVKYACSLKAPLDTDYDVVTTGLIAHARRQSAARAGLSSHRKPIPRPQTTVRSPQIANGSLWVSSMAAVGKTAA